MTSSAVLDQPTESPWQWTAERYLKAVEAGLVDAERRYELIDGQLITMSPQRPPHAGIVQRISRLATLAAIGSGWEVRSQLPVWLTEFDNPEPDLALVDGEFLHKHPSVSNIALLVEVADTSRATDLGAKRDLYASHAVPEYWVVDLAARVIVVHLASTGYANADSVSADSTEPLVCSRVPDFALTPAEIFAT